MSYKLKRRLLWLLSVLLLVALAWTLNLTAFNWWASDVPPHQYRDAYMHRGNTFGAISLGFLLAFVLTLRALVRGRIR
jgi:TRAP-type C4-dicarboxylate transport system permease small subunit